MVGIKPHAPTPHAPAMHAAPKTAAKPAAAPSHGPQMKAPLKHDAVAFSGGKGKKH
jgi:hypothetical protein